MFAVLVRTQCGHDFGKLLKRQAMPFLGSDDERLPSKHIEEGDKFFAELRFGQIQTSAIDKTLLSGNRIMTSRGGGRLAASRTPSGRRRLSKQLVQFFRAFAFC